jgi:nitric oxide reductase large subunit
MEVRRGTLAKLLAVVFVFNLLVMGAGALYSCEHGTYLTVGHAHAAMFGAFGFLHLDAAFTESHAYARSLEFYDSETIQLLFWARLPGDTLIILGTVVFAYDVLVKRFSLRDVSIGEDRPYSIPNRVLAEDDD